MEPINNQLMIKGAAGPSTPETGPATPSESFARVMAARERPGNQKEVADQADREGPGAGETRAQTWSAPEASDIGAPAEAGSEAEATRPVEVRSFPNEPGGEQGSWGDDLEGTVWLTAGIYTPMTTPAVVVPAEDIQLLNPESMIAGGHRPIGSEIYPARSGQPHELSWDWAETVRPNSAGSQESTVAEPFFAGLSSSGDQKEERTPSSISGTFKPSVDQGEARVIEPAVASLLRPTESHPLGQVAPDQPGAPIDGRGFQEEAAALQEKPSARSREYGLEPGPTFPPRGLQNRQPIEVGSSAVLDAQVGVEATAVASKPLPGQAAAEVAETFPQHPRNGGTPKPTLTAASAGFPQPVQPAKTETGTTFPQYNRKETSPAFTEMVSDYVGPETPAGSSLPEDRLARIRGFSDPIALAGGDSGKNRPSGADPVGMVLSEEAPDPGPKAALEILDAGRREPLSGAVSAEGAEKGLKAKDTAGVSVFEQVNPVVLRGLNRRENRILLTLDPPELGSLVIEITRDRNQVSAQLWTDTPQTKEMLDFSQRQLQQTLEQEGFKLNRFQVQVEPDLKSFQDDRWFGGRQPSGEERQSGSRGEDATKPDLPVPETVRRLFSQGNQLVDTWA